VIFDLGDGIPDFVVVLDGIEGFGIGVGFFVRAFAVLQECRIEMPLLGRGVHFEEIAKLRPDGMERRHLARINLVEEGEQASLLMVVVKDQLGNVHGFS
jgi:hypothetical protein